jgi:hypothetical protein
LALLRLGYQDDPIATFFKKASFDADNAVATKRIMWSKLKMAGEVFIVMIRRPKPLVCPW